MIRFAFIYGAVTKLLTNLWQTAIKHLDQFIPGLAKVNSRNMWSKNDHNQKNLNHNSFIKAILL